MIGNTIYYDQDIPLFLDKETLFHTDFDRWNFQEWVEQNGDMIVAIIPANTPLEILDVNTKQGWPTVMVKTADGAVGWFGECWGD